MTRSSVHHGALRLALIELAVADLKRGRHEELSFRDLAVRLGVSHNAPYRHFASKDDFLRALAEFGLDQLAGEYERAVAAGGTAAEQLSAVCRAYVAFSRENRGMFRLIFQNEVEQVVPFDAGSPHPAFALFEAIVARAHGCLDARQARLAALASWSLLHGYVSLNLQGRLAHFHDEAALEAAMIAAATSHVTGMA